MNLKQLVSSLFSTAADTAHPVFTAGRDSTFYDRSAAEQRQDEKAALLSTKGVAPDADIQDIRDDVRATIAVSPVGTGVVRTLSENIIGTGLRLNAQIDREFLTVSDDQADELEASIERNFNQFMTSAQCNSEKRYDGYQLVGKAFHSSVLDGDSFITMSRNNFRNFPYRFAMQYVPATFCSNPNTKADTKTLSGGIQHTSSFIPQTYYFSDVEKTRHSIPQNWSERAAFDRRGLPLVLHWKFDDMSIAVRPTPALYPVVRMLKQVLDLTDAELTTAVNQAFLAVATETERAVGLKSPEATTSSVRRGDGSKKLSVGPAMHVPLGVGEKVKMLTSGHPNPNFDPFMMGMVRHISMGVGVPQELISRQFQASYSASRAALEVAKTRWRMGRQDASRYMQAIHERLLWDAVLDGKIQAPGFLTDYETRRAYMGDYRHQWVGTGFPVIDEKKELEGANLAVANFTKTHQMIAAETSGTDWRSNAKRVARELKVKHDITSQFAPEPEPNDPNAPPNREELEDE